ncbi:unnamed protein product [Closterium sp. NIES-53]
MSGAVRTCDVTRTRRRDGDEEEAAVEQQHRRTLTVREHRLEHRTKHIALRYFLARELQQRGQLRLAYVASEANTTDIFTKALPPGDHQHFCTMLACFALLDWSCDLLFSPTLPMGGCTRTALELHLATPEAAEAAVTAIAAVAARAGKCSPVVGRAGARRRRRRGRYSCRAGPQPRLGAPGQLLQGGDRNATAAAAGWGRAATVAAATAATRAAAAG